MSIRTYIHTCVHTHSACYVYSDTCTYIRTYIHTVPVCTYMYTQMCNLASSVYMCILTYVHVSVSIHVRTYLHVSVSILTYVCTCVRVSIHVSVSILMYVCTYVHVSVYIRTYVCQCLHIVLGNSSHQPSNQASIPILRMKNNKHCI